MRREALHAVTRGRKSGQDPFVHSHSSLITPRADVCSALAASELDCYLKEGASPVTHTFVIVWDHWQMRLRSKEFRDERYS